MMEHSTCRGGESGYVENKVHHSYGTRGKWDRVVQSRNRLRWSSCTLWGQLMGLKLKYLQRARHISVKQASFGEQAVMGTRLQDPSFKAAVATHLQLLIPCKNVSPLLPALPFFQRIGNRDCHAGIS